MPRSRWQPCTDPHCPHLRPRGGDCPLGHSATQRRDAQRRTDAQRPSARKRGYDAAHERRFRGPVLRRDPICVECHQAPAVHADHWPLSRRQLVERGMNPNDPRHGRGLCASCHSAHTAAHDGGFGNETKSPAPAVRTTPATTTDDRP